MGYGPCVKPGPKETRVWSEFWRNGICKEVVCQVYALKSQNHTPPWWDRKVWEDAKHIHFVLARSISQQVKPHLFCSHPTYLRKCTLDRRYLSLKSIFGMHDYQRMIWELVHVNDFRNKLYWNYINRIWNCRVYLSFLSTHALLTKQGLHVDNVDNAVLPGRDCIV